MYTLIVRRYLIIFFIVFLPLQFAWGAAARYCVHENIDKTSHFGHHAHVHTVSIPESALTGALGGTDDPDCNYCHIGCAQPLPGNALSVPVASPAVFEPPDPLPTQFRVPDVIERPNWTLAA
ncbi:MAG TPA: hypothetical protein PK060_18550 [Polaromonas sp.]|uniref:hypothetical protein n=1 Tax=unclassified Polaromonas TaxID=2638319 RepID=UPI000BCE8561|nr:MULTISPECIES: hypothetical protein [unclassified Polaromonas]OYY33262.1 MAG: hypothetical protein B7Y60_19555 [Polaromonas sp. 35-63-35]OYZ17537.1 MAG: hypothetical protein B7Y28_18935 [Polaromonas sp. 16-63-31]OYZ76655.1 MAG: hypothetical protein B7Y09_19550 [Polaromonas sp. 24-63-21]OZA47820.1 MAG: hypothetical protein B7X88_20770 [Polaromonas sp. 17-63-33]OZA85857.1 MAG: hypothetical protein B7X65_19765 [Polaromonas sp. 39-63-25]